jgi:uncharacterized protein YdhG (YjbR/CyaY superfamily)
MVAILVADFGATGSGGPQESAGHDFLGQRERHDGNAEVSCPLEKATMTDDPISSYAASVSTEQRAICELLRLEIDAAMPNSTSKIWHAMPVWFIDDNPVVGYKVTSKHVNLLFWNGQSFNESGLTAAGKFHAAQTKFTEVSQIDVKLLRRWLKKARTDIWDFRAMMKGKGAAT